MTRKLRTPITWFGGKGNMVANLLKYVPTHMYYCEVFGGGASLLFAKQPSRFEVYNDIDSGLVNFFMVLQDPIKFKKFYRKVCLTPYSREIFYKCRESLDSYEDDIERAYKWFIVARMSFSGDIAGGWSHCVREIKRNMSGAVSRYLSIIEMLPEIHNRVMTIQIEHLDWKDCVEKYNDWSNEGFYYLDPPYLPETRRNGKYRYEMTREDHKELIDWLLSKARVKIMLSGYDNKLYRKLERYGWKKVTWNIGCYAVGRTKHTNVLGNNATYRENQRRQECIWINYNIANVMEKVQCKPEIQSLKLF